MEKLNRKGFFSTLFGGIAGVVAGSSVKASEPIVSPPVVETVVYCDKLVFTHSSGASCVMSFKDSDNFTVRVNNSENISINIHSPLKKPNFVKTETDYGFYGNNGNNGNTQMTITSNGNLGLGTCNPTAKLDIRG
jgi:hypothetical protein